MRKLFALSLAAVVLSYAAGAVYLFRQERWVDELPASVDPHDIEHPDAILALLQSRFAANRFRDEELELVRRALLQAPSFYQSPFLLATFHAGRLESPDRVRAAYEAAVSRYPANGRLQLAYGIWLLESRGDLQAWVRPENPNELHDPLPEAEACLKRAMELEPELSWQALSALSRNRVPSERWGALVPNHALARTSLLDALFQEGRVAEVWAALERGELPSDRPEILRRIVHWGLEGDAPAVALDAALRWKTLVESRRGEGPDLFEPTLWIARAHLALGDSASAYDALEATLQRVESKFGPSSRLSLDFLCAMGEEYLRKGQLATAEALFRQAASRSPSHVPALLGLARSLGQSGDEEGALSHYEEALELEPGNDAARRELTTLLAKRERMR
jgi:tetratricopeptide (TPR) repeat protein